VTDHVQLGVSPSILLSMNAQSLGWNIVIGELVDNSLDADASRVEVRFEKGNTLVVKDDGAGCDDIMKMLTLGLHYRQPTTALGRWGVGLKDTACWLWADMRLVTRHKDVIRRARVNWPQLAKSPDWRIPKPTEEPSVYGDDIGTVLTFRNFKKRTANYSKLVEDLSYTFSPALRSGRQILLKSPRQKKITVCSGWIPPVMEKVIEDEFMVGGKGVKIRVGIVPEGVKNKRSGFSFSHRHRIITNSALGSNGHSVSRICGLVELDRKWVLSKNKTDIVSDQIPLAEAIWVRCGDIIKESAKQARIISNRELEAKVSDALQSLLSPKKKARRDVDSKKNGTKDPTGKGSKHRRAKKVQPGDSLIAKCAAGAFRMEQESNDEGNVGHVDIPGGVIYLDPNHGRIKHHIESDNTEALVDTCMTLLTHEAVETNQRGCFPSMKNNEGFVEILSTILAAQEPE